MPNDKRALLLGNGINQLDSTQSISWGDLLKSIKTKFDIQVDLNNEFKPFPLAFEEMMHRKSGENPIDNKLRRLKQAIKGSIDHQLSGKDGFNEYHTKFMQLGYDDILTTNYDYSLQKSVMSNFEDEKKDLALNRQEIKHSLKRGYEMPRDLGNIWHIHGELYDSRNIRNEHIFYPEESILIGYDQYTDYFLKIQENFDGIKNNTKSRKHGLKNRILNGENGKYWTEIFFTHNVDIIGLGLDFSENHIWWIINQRAIAIRNHEHEELKVNNTIRFFFPKMEASIDPTESGFFEKAVKKLNGTNKLKAIAELLWAFGVEIVEVDCESYEEFYDKLLLRYL